MFSLSLPAHVCISLNFRLLIMVVVEYQVVGSDDKGNGWRVDDDADNDGRAIGE